MNKIPLYLMLGIVLVAVNGSHISEGRVWKPTPILFGGILDWQSEKFFLENISHDPQGQNLNHDYYEGTRNLDIKRLIFLVDRAHTNTVVPALRKATFAPPTLREGYYQQALRDLNYALERLVNHPRALLLMESVAKLVKRPNLPRIYYQRAVSMYPNRALPQAQYGKYLIDNEETADGIQRLKIALKIDSKLKVGHAWLSWAYKKNGKQDLADQFAQQAKALGYRGKLPN